MGGPGGDLWRRVSYQLQPHDGTHAPGALTVQAADGSTRTEQQSIWEYLQQQLSLLNLSDCQAAAAQLPFNLWGGFVGYLGYELKAECGGTAAHQSSTPDAAFWFADQLIAVDHQLGDVFLLALYDSSMEAGVAGADSWLQQTEARIRQLAAHPPVAADIHSRTGGANTGCASVPAHAHAGSKQRYDQHQQPSQKANYCAAQAVSGNGTAPSAAQRSFHLLHSKQQYLANVAACQEALHDGESYELCLTTALQRGCAADPWQFYTTLRKVNAAPYAAWMQFGATNGTSAGAATANGTSNGSAVTGAWHDSLLPAANVHEPHYTAANQHTQAAHHDVVSSSTQLTICCSSPERFLRGDRGGVLEAKPIKGTAPRSTDAQEDAALAAALAASEKERAENLMIVDLLRNDLGRVCEVGSIHVPGLIELESYATVHQLVSTVRGLRRQGLSMVECIQAAFPGGSMTGAPKIRSMEILDKLEGQARGVYSGALGYLSVNDTFDLNIVIRTAVFSGDTVTIGAGGAIVVQSDCEGEYNEMRLKARALRNAMALAEGQPAVVVD